MVRPRHGVSAFGIAKPSQPGMKSVIVGALLVACVMARPGPDNLDFKVTVDYVNHVLEATKNFQQYWPPYVQSAIAGLTEEQKQQMADLANAFHANELPRVSSYEEFNKLVVERYPALGQMFQQILTAYNADVARLGPRSQAFSKELEKKSFEMMNPDRVIWACNMFNGAKPTIKEAESIINDPSEVSKLDEVFPGTVKFAKSKEFQAYVNAMNAMPDDLDCDKDREQIVAALRLMDKQGILPKAN
ncbi:unnamed protein product [Caenorhabditis auriculariae]|uniref:Uncharacterized protein n=1 Tax=Caenorhabditis auriculariae TaxID=2777116 RepID=A0A8S1H2W7_9PELO|nr:unnamed protein product [Caenorhabditis auriculariae]